MRTYACYYEVMVNVIEIVMKSKHAVMPTCSYTDTVENAVAAVRHFLGRGNYDTAVVYDADRQPVFRARRWFTPVVEPMQGETALNNQAPGGISGSGTKDPPPILRVVPRGVNPYEFAARVGKAGKLAETMHRYGITKADALLMDDSMWRLAAAGAGVNPPSPVTQMLAIEALARIEAAGERGAA